MSRIHKVETKQDQARVRELFWEYLQWANDRVNGEFGVNFDINKMLEDDMEKAVASNRPQQS